MHIVPCAALCAILRAFRGENGWKYQDGGDRGLERPLRAYPPERMARTDRAGLRELVCAQLGGRLSTPMPRRREVNRGTALEENYRHSSPSRVSATFPT